MIPPDATAHNAAHDPALADALAAWQLPARRSAEFRPAVWQRIRASAGSQSWGAYLRAHLAAWSLAAGVAAVVAGWAGQRAAESRLAADRDRMATTYLAEIDPRVLAQVRPAL